MDNPSYLAAGVVGVERAEAVGALVTSAYIDNAIAQPDRVALLCAAWDHDDMPAGIHATGASLAGLQFGAELPDVRAIWDRMLLQAGSAAVLEATRLIGAHRVPPADLVDKAEAHLGARVGAWHDILAYAAWHEAMYRANVHRAHATDDARLEDWLTRLV